MASDICSEQETGGKSMSKKSAQVPQQMQEKFDRITAISDEFAKQHLNNEFFGYWFDFGDDWWHQVQVLSIADDSPKKKYPCITKKVGASPPQYANF
jgi:hypothetical protein